MKIAIIGAGNLGISIADGLYINNMITELYLTKNNISHLQNGTKSLIFLLHLTMLKL